MKNRTLLVIFSLVLILSLLLTACGAKAIPTPVPAKAPEATKPAAVAPAATVTPVPTKPPAPTAIPAKPITLKAAFWPPATHHLYKNVLLPLCKEIEEKTNGRVKFELYPAEALTKAKDQHDANVSGLADIVSISVSSYTPGRFPLTTLFELPFFTPDDTILVADALQKVFPAYLSKEWGEVKVLSLMIAPPYNLGSTKKIASLEDMKGKIFKVTGKMGTEAVAALGASPVDIPAPDMYSSLQRGIIDGTFYAAASWPPFKLQEVCKYRLIPGLYRITGSVMTINLNVWKSLPEDIQKVFETVGAKGTRMVAESYNAADAESIEVLKAAGVQDVVLPPAEVARWQKLVQPIWDKYINEQEAKGIPARKAFEEIQRLIKQ